MQCEINQETGKLFPNGRDLTKKLLFLKKERVVPHLLMSGPVSEFLEQVLSSGQVFFRI